MKKITLTALLMVSTVSFLMADAYSTFSGLVQFNASIASLTTNTAAIDPGKLYLIEGMVTSIRVVNPDPANYYAEVEFMGSEWEGTETIHSYKLLLIFSKPAYSDLLVARSSQARKEGQIGVNSRGLALVQFVSTLPAGTPDPNVPTGKLPVFIAHEFRILK